MMEKVSTLSPFNFQINTAKSLLQLVLLIFPVFYFSISTDPPINQSLDQNSEDAEIYISSGVVLVGAEYIHHGKIIVERTATKENSMKNAVVSKIDKPKPLIKVKKKNTPKIILKPSKPKFVFTGSTPDQNFGLENIHATEGAAIVVKGKDNSVVYIASNSKNNSTPQVATRQTRAIKKIIKKKSPIAFREKTSRATKKVVEKQAPKAICKSSPESEGSYFSESQTSKISCAPSQLSLGKYLGTQHSFLNFLFVFQEKQNSLFRFYKTKHLENSLFTRPPPSALI